MKNAALIAKILTALAALIGVAYVIATYGDKIVAWAKKLLAACPCQCEDEEDDDYESDLDCPIEEYFADDDILAEEIPVEDTPAEEKAPAEENAPVAEEDDFEG